ncbi:MAG: DUF2339 domain-containing protein [Acidobacteriota bacterium]|nr:DUF2339 domain-containing protein [Acidobacteriota bacterium]
MSSSLPDDERIEALAQAIARLETQHGETNRRLARMEEALGARTAPTHALQRVEEPEVEPPKTGPPAPQTKPRLETQVGLTWINRVGAITLVIGAGFFFKYAIDNQWIGETGRVLLGMAAGCAGIGAGDLLWRKDQKTFAQGISGTGIAILYLSFYAAYAFYHIVPFSPAFLLMALTTAVAGALALRYNAVAIAAVGLFGGYVTPVLLSGSLDQPRFFFSYLLLLNAGAVSLARWRKWRGLEWLALLATAYLFARWYGSHYQSQRYAVATLFSLLYYAMFVSSAIRFVALAAHILTAIGLALFWPFDLAVYATLTLALATTGLAAIERHKWLGGVFFPLAGFWFSYAIWYVREPRPLGPILLLLSAAFLLFLGWIPWRILVRKKPAGYESLLPLLLNGAVYFGVVYGLLQALHHAYLGPLAAALAMLHLGLALALRHADSTVRWLFTGAGTAFLTLAIPIQFAGYRITMAWALEAAAMTWIGRRTQTQRLVYAASGLFVLTVLRLALFDAPATYDSLLNPRFLTFLTAAISFCVAAYWIGGGAISLATYVAGHVVMLWGLILEVLGWAARNAAPENLSSVESASISILMALYAVLLIASGVLTRTAVNRIGGLVLIGFVVLKLYVYDVWLLVRIYRVTAFAALGALLLLTSYLYSRYRASIENWWSDKTG